MPHKTSVYYLQEPSHLNQIGADPIQLSSAAGQDTPCTSSLSVVLTYNDFKLKARKTVNYKESSDSIPVLKCSWTAVANGSTVKVTF